MAQLDTLDIVVLAILLVGSVAYFTKGTYWGVQKDPYASTYASASAGGGGGSRSIIEKMDESGKNCVIFYGSQTGTAEDYASRLAKEGSQRFGLKTMTADLEEYDFENLDAFPEDKTAFFILATYGEGEPTDNAVSFYEFLTNEESSFSKGGSASESPLSNLKYVTFGLGNNTYEHYNAMVRNVDESLKKLGASRIGEAGEGDDGAGTMEEDFLAWKEPMWEELASKLDLEEREAVFEAAFEVTEKDDLTAASENVYVGEPNKNHLSGGGKGPYNANNPYIAPIVENREIFHDKSRECLHVEVDISNSNLNYTTGDHIAIWPNNSGKEVDRFLDVIGLRDKRDTVVSVKGIDTTAKVPFPTPTTYDAVARYHMEICAPVSRQMVSTLAQFAPNEEIKQEVQKMGSDKDYFAENVSRKNLNIAQLLEIVGKGEKWTKIPFSLWIEGLNKLQSRYYSISSSSAVQKKKISVTAIVESVEKDGAPHVVKGVTTNLLLSLREKANGASNPDPHSLNYQLDGPRGKYKAVNEGINIPVHVRHSNFKLPSDPKTPIIMVGPGTGVAPFRGFIMERANQARNGEEVGKALLFFGCRNRNDDFVYKEEWEQWQKDLGDKFELVCAFSREGPQKVYVQHKMKEKAEEVNKLLEEKANFYVCGDAANMAREVNQNLAQIISSQRGLSEQKGEELVKRMRTNNQYQEDVWS